MIQRVIAASLLVWTGIVLVNSARACPVCISIGDPFSLPHPHALRIAVAARESMDRGLLPNDSQPLIADPFIDLVRIANHQLSSVLPANDERFRSNERVVVDVLTIDSVSVHRIELRSGDARVLPLIGGQHPKADVVLVTTRPVLAALADLQMTIREAIDLGVLEIDGDDSVLLKASATANTQTNDSR